MEYFIDAAEVVSYYDMVLVLCFSGYQCTLVQGRINFGVFRISIWSGKKMKPIGLPCSSWTQAYGNDEITRNI